jgi:hypothetical protein
VYYLRQLTVVLLLLLSNSSANAQTFFGSAYDCWIGNAGNLYTTHFIRCIADRDHLTGVGTDGELVLERIHALLHQAAIGEVERIVQSDPELIRQGKVRSVALYSYPAEWSWEDGLPQKLVNSAWCLATDDCRISMFRR